MIDETNKIFQNKLALFSRIDIILNEHFSLNPLPIKKK